MSGSSVAYSAEEMAEMQRTQQLRHEIFMRIRAANPSGVQKVDLAARDEERPTLNARPKFVAASFAPAKTSAQQKAEDDARIAAARAAIKPRDVQTQATEAEKVRPDNPNRPPRVTSGRKKNDCQGQAENGAPQKTAPKPETSKATPAVKAPTPEISPAKVEIVTPEERERRIEAHCAAIKAGKVVAVDQSGGVSTAKETISYTYDLPGKELTFKGECERNSFPSVAVGLARDGSRHIRPAEGVILTLIHRRMVTDPVSGKVTNQEFSVGRRLIATDAKAHDAGHKALADGLPRSKSCPTCKGMGRVHDNRSISKVCPECIMECGKKCEGPACVLCRGEGFRGRGTVKGEPMPVHAFTVTTSIDRDGSRGVLALDRPLSGDPVIPSRKRGAICTGGKPDSGVWQSRAKTTRVTFSGG